MGWGDRRPWAMATTVAVACRAMAGNGISDHAMCRLGLGGFEGAALSIGADTHLAIPCLAIQRTNALTTRPQLCHTLPTMMPIHARLTAVCPGETGAGIPRPVSRECDSAACIGKDCRRRAGWPGLRDEVGVSVAVRASIPPRVGFPRASLPKGGEQGAVLDRS